MTVKEQALKFAELLNQAIPVETAAHGAGLDPLDLFGESFVDSSDSIPIDDPDNNTIDVGWDGDLHYQVRRWWDDDANMKVWEVFERRTLTKSGKLIEQEA